MFIVGTYTIGGVLKLISGAEGIDAERIRQDIARMGGDQASLMFKECETPEDAEIWIAEHRPAPTVEERAAGIKAALAALDLKYFNNEATRVNAMFEDETALAILKERRDAHEAEAAPLRSELAGLGA